VPSCRSIPFAPNPTPIPTIWPNRSPQHLSGTISQSISMCGIFLNRIFSLHFTLVFLLGELVCCCQLIDWLFSSVTSYPPKPLAIAPLLLPLPLSSWHMLLIVPRLIFACPDLLILLSLLSVLRTYPATSPAMCFLCTHPGPTTCTRSYPYSHSTELCSPLAPSRAILPATSDGMP
jgi:hypothetical protein